MFARNGAMMPVKNSMESKLPLCGDLFYFRKGTLLHFSGNLDAGTAKVSRFPFFRLFWLAISPSFFFSFFLSIS
jgi:hypothetical protein